MLAHNIAYIAPQGGPPAESRGQKAGRVGTGKNRPGGKGGGPEMQAGGRQKLKTPPMHLPAARNGMQA
jgi:hypothetical protein